MTFRNMDVHMRIHMRAILLGGVIAASAVSVPSSAAYAQQRYSFAGLKWGAAPAVVQATLKREGFALVSSDNRVLGFEGRALDEIAWVMALFADGKLTHVNVTFALVPESHRWRMYDAIVASLERVYGAPDSRAHNETCWYAATGTSESVCARIATSERGQYAQAAYRSAAGVAAAERRATEQARLFGAPRAVPKPAPPRPRPWVANAFGRFYYKSDCAAAKNIPPEERLYYDTEGAAQGAGFMRAPSC